jgi:DNA-binding XRE family transcriptional regulator
MPLTLEQGSFHLDADAVRSMRHRLGLKRPEFARFMGVAERTLADWERGQLPTGMGLQLVREKLDLAAKLQSLAESPSALGQWLTNPGDYFEGLSPLEVIERGQVSRIWRLIYRLGAGEPA